MNQETESLLRQFIPEAQDLLEQAGRSLLALERIPGDASLLNELFRAVHTLKGTSGLFAIEPLTRLVHAAEDLLFAVQAGRMVLAPDLADGLLESLDQVGLWIDSLAEASVLPNDATAVSERWVLRLRAMLGKGGGLPNVATESGFAGASALPVWLDGLSCGTADTGGDLIAIRYSPDTHCFFRGEDPLGLLRQLPGIRALRLDAVEPWPPLGEIDPFQCNICLRAIVAAERDEIEHHLRYSLDQVELVALPVGWPTGALQQASHDDNGADAVLLDILEGQRKLLRAIVEPGAEIGHRAAAVRALRNMLQHISRSDLLAGLNEASAARKAAQLLNYVDVIAAAVQCVARPTAVPPQEALVRATNDSGTRPPAASSPSTLRVEQSKIDVMMNLTGELVVAKNALAYLARRAEQGQMSTSELVREIKDRQALVNRIAENMQAAVMSVRMLPVEQIFQRFPRLVRDVSRRIGKRVELVVEGGETEADKNIIEAIADPLIHMVRNSLDHGIETPDVRRQVGKPEFGTVWLKAVQDNDEVLIRVIDDGRGINPAALRRKAVEQGLIDEERAQRLSDEDAVALIFAPGLSTAAEVF